MRVFQEVSEPLVSAFAEELLDGFDQSPGLVHTLLRSMNGLRREASDLSRQAPNLVRRRALAITSGMRCWAGITPRLPAPQARSVKAVTTSAPQ